MVLNFEARGTRGPSLMFETGPGNLWTIRRLADTPFPIAASYSYEVYRRLPNDTDYTVFKHRGIPGLNFAHIHGAVGYHTELDSVRHLDPATLQHHGSNALALVHALGDADLAEARQGGDAVYFNPLGSAFVYYPASWVVWLLAALGVATVGVIALGVSRRRIGLGATALGLVLDVVVLAVLGGAVLVLRGVLVSARYDFRIWGEGSSVAWALLGLTLLVLGAAAALQRLTSRFVRPADAAAAGLVLWFLVTAAVSVIAPGASYLFMVPLLFQLVALAVLFQRGAERTADRAEATAGWTGPAPLALLALAAVVASLVWAPTLALLAVGLQAGSAVVLAVLGALLLALLAPQVEVVTATRPRWAVPLALAVVGLAVIVAVRSASGFGPDNPRPTNLIYALDADKGEAVWASFKPQPDPWTEAVLPESPELRALPEFLGFPRKLATGPAPVLALAEPRLEIADGGAAGASGGAPLHLRIVPPAGADRMRVLLSPRDAVEAVTVEGREVALPETGAADAPYVIVYFAPPTEGLDLELTSSRPDEVRVAAVGQWWGVPSADQGGPGPKPDGFMQAPWPWDADTTLVRRAWTLGDLREATDQGMAGDEDTEAAEPPAR